MNVHSLQFKFLITIISAMLAITIFIGGLSIYELDQFVQLQTEDLCSYAKLVIANSPTSVNGYFKNLN